MNNSLFEGTQKKLFNFAFFKNVSLKRKIPGLAYSLVLSGQSLIQVLKSQSSLFLNSDKVTNVLPPLEVVSQKIFKYGGGGKTTEPGTQRDMEGSTFSKFSNSDQRVLHKISRELPNPTKHQCMVHKLLYVIKQKNLLKAEIH